MSAVAASPVLAHALVHESPAAERVAPRLTADELVAEAIRCIMTGRDFPAHLREPSAVSPGLASVEDRIARILAGPIGF